MADVFNPEKRSEVMSKIQGKNTKPEILVRHYLHSLGFRYRKNVSTLPGKPDLVLRKHNCIIFVNGCFWHGHEGCKYFTVPKTRTQWWLAKIEKTKQNDARNIEELKKSGWHVIIIWECDIKRNFQDTMDKIIKEIGKPSQSP